MYFGVMIYYEYHKCLQFDFKHELLHGFHSWQTSFTSLAIITIINKLSYMSEHGSLLPPMYGISIWSDV